MPQKYFSVFERLLRRVVQETREWRWSNGCATAQLSSHQHASTATSELVDAQYKKYAHSSVVNAAGGVGSCLQTGLVMVSAHMQCDGQPTFSSNLEASLSTSGTHRALRSGRTQCL
ncbi:hypothetical protein TRVL_09771 [Trypanosoma vivax]|nr:hypothetical protein TRVL_09771 [Trypanosoma vivax]